MTEALICCKLITFIGDSSALEIPPAIIARIIDFRCYTENCEDYGRLFAFCVEYLRIHSSSSSHIFRTLDVTRLSKGEFERMICLDELNWSVLNKTICRFVIRLRNDLALSRAQHDEQQSVIVDHWDEIERQRR
jgi:hypothetical protein